MVKVPTARTPVAASGPTDIVDLCDSCGLVSIILNDRNHPNQWSLTPLIRNGEGNSTSIQDKAVQFAVVRSVVHYVYVYRRESMESVPIDFVVRNIAKIKR